MRLFYANPDRYDYLHASLLEGLLRLPEVELSCLNRGNYGVGAHHCFEGDVERAFEAISRFDLIIIGSEGKYSDIGSSRSLFTARRSPNQRWVLVDSGDLASLPRRIPWRTFDVVVKREYLLPSSHVATLVSGLLGRRVRHPVENQFRRHRWLPFPNVQANALARPTVVSFNQRRQLPLQRRIRVGCEPVGLEARLVQVPHRSPVRAVTCTLTPNTEPRRELLGYLAHRAEVLVGIVGPPPVPEIDLVATGAVSPARASDHSHNDVYLTWLRDHRASISFPGAGFDSARFWEILGSGSLLISKRVALDLPVPFRDGEHYLGFDSVAELDEAIAFAVSDSGEVDEIRLRGHAHAVEHYSAGASARRFLDFTGRLSR